MAAGRTGRGSGRRPERRSDPRTEPRTSDADPQRPQPPKEPQGSKLTLITFDDERFDEREIEDVSELKQALEAPGTHWLNVCGLHEPTVREVSDTIGLHPLTYGDIIHIGQRPQVEEYADYLFVIMRMLMVRNVAVPPSAVASEDDTFTELKAKVALRQAANRNGRRRNGSDEREPEPELSDRLFEEELEDPNRLKAEQFSLVLMERLVVTFQENFTDPFGALRTRLREGHGQIRTRSAAFVAYSLVNLVIDQYFTVVETYGDNLEALEDELLLHPSREAFAQVNNLRRNLMHVRRAIWPLREVMAKLEQPGTAFIDQEVSTYMRDAHSHALQVIETVEVLREIVTSLHDIYLTSLNTRMNDVIKVLTVISTIFIPLTFLAGLYGMNFENQPEYTWPWAYPALLGLMLVLVLLMLWLFRRKGWV